MESFVAEKPEIEKEFLTPNPYSRPEVELEQVNALVVHYTANPGATAENNRDYFEGLKLQEGKDNVTYASSHYVIGLEGEIIQCIPLSEISYASNERNTDTISIECCHEDDSGKFTQETYDSLVYLLTWLCAKYGLSAEDIIRHYDVTGKNCPKYYVEHEKSWKGLKKDVKSCLDAEKKKALGR